MKSILLVLVFPLLFLSCSALTGEEIARVSVNEISTKESPKPQELTIDLLGNEEISLWSDMDFEWDGEVELRFIVEAFLNGEAFNSYEVNPTQTDITYNEVKTDMFGSHKWYFFGRNLKIPIKESGTYSFKMMLISTDNPTLKINRADIILMK